MAIAGAAGGVEIMLFYIHHKGKEYKVRVESRDQQIYIQYDKDQEELADLRFQGNDCNFIHDRKVFYANVVGQKSQYTVWRPEGNLEFEVESEYRRIVGLLKGQDLHDDHNIYAKMPGKIVKVIGKKGARIEKGETVMIMEAMKMENEIRATFSGEIVNIFVNEGQAVESGGLLVEIKPAQ